MQQQLFHLKEKRNVLYPPIVKKNVQAFIKNQEDMLPGLIYVVYQSYKIRKHMVCQISLTQAFMYLPVILFCT
jgi:hypothetical protein